MGVIVNNYDVIIIAETWLTPSMHSEEFFPSDFIVYRKDRYDFDTCLRGGGVLIAVNSNVPSSLIARHSAIDLIAVRLNISNNPIVIIGLYARHGSSLDYYNEIINFIDSKVLPQVHAHEHLLIIGDFNLPNVTWFEVDGLLASTSPDERTTAVVDYCSGISTRQINRISNSLGNFLDLAFSNELLFSDVLACEDIMGCSSIHHTPITINIYYYSTCTYFPSYNNFFYNFSKADFTSLNEFFSNLNWNFIQDNGNLNASVASFHALLRLGIERFVPMVKRSPSFREPWYNSDLVHLENLRNRLHKLYRLHGDRHYPEFSRVRKEFKCLNGFLYNNYMLRIEQDLCSNPKKFWRFVNNKRSTSGFPAAMTYQGMRADCPLAITDLFAKFFESVYEPARYCALRDFQGCSVFTHISFSSREICASLLDLDTQKSAGHDDFPPILFRNCADVLAQPIASLFNESLRRGIFPDPWKNSIIHPIFKSGKRSEVENYRGIAILSVLPKLFEQLVHRFLSFHLRPHLSPAQHGFFSGRSTVTNLLSFCGELFNCANSKLQLDVIYTDFAKAFDKIDHAILIDKLAKLNCEFIPIEWLSSYLTNRWQLVKISGSFSRRFHASSGVPQGSHLGPLLFLVFINDVVDCFHYAKCLLFADDMKIFAPIAHVSDCVLLQRDLDCFCTWSINNKLPVNVIKCKTMSFFRIRTPIIQEYYLFDSSVQRFEYLSDLGVIFSSDLSFTRHINYIINRAYQMLGFVKRNSADFYDPLTLKILYVAFVRSILEYASPVWSPFYTCHSNRIESLQKQFIIFALRRLPHGRRDGFALSPYQDRCNLLGVQRLDHRRVVAAVIFVSDLLNGRIDCNELLARLNIYAPERLIRRRHVLLRIDTVLNNFGLSEPVLIMSRLLNSVCHLFDLHTTRVSFRKVLFNHLVGRPC